MPQSARQLDPNGFLLVKGCPISSYGVFQYSAAQVGLKDGDPDRVVNVYRPEAAVNDPQLIQSLQHVPLINDHEMLSGFADDETATPPEKYGVDGILFDVTYQQPWLRGDVKVFSRTMQSDLESGKKDLSLGYTCDFLMQSGTFQGVQYDVVQTNMRGNHIALVAAGRVPGAKVLDGRNSICYDHLDVHQPFQKESQMAKRKAMDSDVVANLRAQLKALLPAFEQFLNEEAAEPAHADPAAVPAAAVEAADPTAATPVAPTPALPAAQPAAAEPAPAAAAPDPAALLAQLEEICQQLRALAGGGASEGGGESDPSDQGGEEGGDPTAQASPDEPTQEGDQMPEALQEPEGDAIKGLNTDPTSHLLNVDNETGATGEQGKASPGPAAGKHTGADAAMRAVYADIATKTKLYDRLSKVVGAFDGAIDIQTATASDVAAYGIKKLNLIAPKGQEAVVLDSYLRGVESQRRSPTAKPTVAADAAVSEVPAIAAYFKE